MQQRENTCTSNINSIPIIQIKKKHDRSETCRSVLNINIFI